MIQPDNQDGLLASLSRPELHTSGSVCAACNTGRKEMYLANGKLVRALRKRAGLSQLALSRLAGVCVRTVRTMENAEECTKLSMIQLVAAALDVDVHDILGKSKESLLPVHRWEDLMISLHDPTLARQALAHDMRGEFDLAVALLDQGLADLDPTDSEDFRDWAFLSIKKFSVLSNAGEHQRALTGLEQLAHHPGWRRRKAAHLGSLRRYHRAVCLRRLGFFDEAAVEFGELLEDKHHAIGARHQLGALCMDMWEVDMDMPLLEMARKHLEASRRSWEKEGGGYRSAFSLRRLAELARRLGEPDTAAVLYELAYQRFADDACERYVQATREDIAKLARERGRSAS